MRSSDESTGSGISGIRARRISSNDPDSTLMGSFSSAMTAFYRAGGWRSVISVTRAGDAGSVGDQFLQAADISNPQHCTLGVDEIFPFQRREKSGYRLPRRPDHLGNLFMR